MVNLPTAEPSAPITGGPPVDRQYFSTGHLACHFQISVATVRSILCAAGIGAVYHQNEIEFYDGHAMIALSNALRKGKSE